MGPRDPSGDATDTQMIMLQAPFFGACFFCLLTGEAPIFVCWQSVYVCISACVGRVRVCACQCVYVHVHVRVRV